MMKKAVFIGLLLMPLGMWAVAKEWEELEKLDQVIATTERQLVIHKELREQVAEFQKQQERFHQGEQTKELAIQMVQTAAKILKMGQEHQLTHLFSPFFMEELKLFSGISQKKNENHSIH